MSQDGATMATDLAQEFRLRQYEEEHAAEHATEQLVWITEGRPGWASDPAALRKEAHEAKVRAEIRAETFGEAAALAEDAATEEV